MVFHVHVGRDQIKKGARSIPVLINETAANVFSFHVTIFTSFRKNDDDDNNNHGNNFTFRTAMSSVFECTHLSNIKH